MGRLHTDLSVVPVGTAPSPATSGTTVIVTDANAALLPNIYPWMGVFKPSGATPTRVNAELVIVISASSSGGNTTYTIVRAQGLPATTARSVIVGDDFYEAASAAWLNDGWCIDQNTWTYSSVDGDTGVVTINADLTGVIHAGDRIKITQTTDKYFIATKISVSAGTTTLTMWGGTDFTLANAAITFAAYSHVKSPVGMNMDPLKWTLQLSDHNDQTQNSPVGSTYYNIGSLSLSVPIGSWEIMFFVNAKATSGSTSGIYVSISTANNTQGDIDFSCFAAAPLTSFYGGTHRKKNIILTSRTTYYLNAIEAYGNETSLVFFGEQGPNIIRAICSYL
jgi:hypothetical protein